VHWKRRRQAGVFIVDEPPAPPGAVAPVNLLGVPAAEPSLQRCSNCGGSHWLEPVTRQSADNGMRVTVSMELECVFCDQDGTENTHPNIQGIRNVSGIASP
jgi:hypothetical protein